MPMTELHMIIDNSLSRGSAGGKKTVLCESGDWSAALRTLENSLYKNKKMKAICSISNISSEKSMSMLYGYYP